MAIKEKITRNDELTKLMLALDCTPLTWKSQKKIVELFTELIEKQSIEHKIHVERLEKIIRNMQENQKLMRIRSC